MRTSEKVSTAQNIQKQFSIKSLLSHFLFPALHSDFLLITLFLPPCVSSPTQVFLLHKHTTLPPLSARPFANLSPSYAFSQGWPSHPTTSSNVAQIFSATIPVIHPFIYSFPQQISMAGNQMKIPWKSKYDVISALSEPTARSGA